MNDDYHGQANAADELAGLTQRYARYARSASGLGGVLGGLLVLVSYFAGALIEPLGIAARLALAAAPLLWIVGKELLRSSYYQRLGEATQRWSRADRNWHIGFTLFTALVSVVILVVVLGETLASPGATLTAGTLGYLAYIAAMPVLVWFFMRTPLEFIAGVFLVAQAALMLGGGNYQLGQQPQAPIAAVVLIVVGIRQHLDYRDVRRRLIEVRGRLRQANG